MSRICVDVPSSGGVGVDTIRVVAGSEGVEVDASVMEWILFFFSRPLPLLAISEINIYNN